jgi:Na+/alanine symporter
MHVVVVLLDNTAIDTVSLCHITAITIFIDPVYHSLQYLTGQQMNELLF